MANQEVQRILIKYEADIKALRKDLDGTKKQLRSVEKQASSSGKAITNSFKAIGTAVAAAFSVQLIKQFISESAKLADTQLKAEAQLLTALKGRKDAQQELIKQAADLQKVTTFGDEVTIQAQSRIAAFVQETESIKELTRVSQDFAAAKGVDLANAADLITKTFASSTNALVRYGINIEGAAGSTERLESLVQALDAAFKGQAETLARTGLGPLQQVQNAIGDLQEEIGKIILDRLPKFTDNLNSATQAATEFVKQLAGAEERTGGIGIAAQFVADRIADLERNFRSITSPIAGLIELVTNIGQSLGIVNNKVDAAEKGFTVYSGALSLVSKGLSFVSEVALTVIGSINGLVKVISASGTEIKAFFADVGNAAALFAQGRFAEAARAIRDADFAPDFTNIKAVFVEGLAEITSLNDPESKQAIEESAERAGVVTAAALAPPMAKAGKQAGEVLLSEFAQAYRQGIENLIANRRDFESLDDGFLFNTSNLDDAWTDYRNELLSKFPEIQKEVEDFNEDAEDLRVLGMTPEEFNDTLEEAKESTLSQATSIASGLSTISSNIAAIQGEQAERSKGLATFEILLAQSVALAKGIQSAATLPFPGNLAAIASVIGAITGFFAQVKALDQQAQVPGFAVGTSDAPGGAAWVGEEGPEIMHVPKGARIFTADASKREKSLIDAINEGRVSAFIEDTYVKPALSTFADNLAKSAPWQAYDDFYLRQAVKANKTVRLDKTTIRALRPTAPPRFH